MPIDLTSPSASLYCERTGPGLWHEPLNALTSLIVIAVAIVGFFLLRRRGRLSPSVVVLLVLAGGIGIGSFLLHSFATVWAELVDVIAIWTFVMVYGVLALRRFAPERYSLPVSSAFSLAVFGSGIALSVGDVSAMVPGVMTPLSGTAQYVPAALMIAAVIWVIRDAAHPSILQLGLGVGFFVLSLTFRALDMWMCDALPFGTHFLWHLTNIVVFWHLIEAYAMHGPGPDRRRGATIGSAPPEA